MRSVKPICSIPNGLHLYSEAETSAGPSVRSKRDSTRPQEVDYIWNKLHTAGHWASWGPWTCDALCGRGAYFRKRHCVPSDDFGLPVCKGNTIERSQEECKAKCPGLSEIRRKWIGPKLTNAEMSAHLKLLRSSHWAFQRKVGGVIQLDCYNILTAHFLSNYSGSSLYWERNGQKLRYDFNRMTITDYSILGIANLETTDSGVYECKMKFTKRFHLTILVFSLIVIGKPYDLHATANTAIKVKCNGDVIGKLFPGLYVQWIVNETKHILKDYIATSQVTTNDDVITGFLEEDTGLWMCVIIDRTTNRTWLTNAVYVKVIPSEFVAACRLILEHVPLQWVLLVIGVLAILAIIGIFITIRTKRKRKQKLLKRLNDILKISAEIEEDLAKDKKTEKEHQPNIRTLPKVIVKTKIKTSKKAKTKARSLKEKIRSALRKITAGKQEIKTLKDAIDQHDIAGGSIGRTAPKEKPKIRKKKHTKLTETSRRFQIKRRPLTFVSPESFPDELGDSSETVGPENYVALGRRVVTRRNIASKIQKYDYTPEISENESESSFVEK